MPENRPGNPGGRLARFYSDGAAIYEQLWVPALRPAGEELIRCMPLQGSERILDAATGVYLQGDLTARTSELLVGQFDQGAGS